MEDIYKKALNELRANKLTQAPSDENSVIYGVEWFYGAQLAQKPKEHVSEKSLVLDSFSQKVKEEMASNNTNKIEKNGAIIEVKGIEPNAKPLEVDSVQLEELRDLAASLTNKSCSELRFDSKSDIRVMFVSDYFMIKEDYEGSEFNSLFEGPISVLFSNMVKAMKIPKENYFLSAIKTHSDDDKGYLETLLKEVDFFRPQLIIALGVSATHGLLNIKTRLKDIHGEFYDLKLNDFQTQLMPIFSPHLLGSAPNMKKIAWVDMQKAMEKLSL
jgi:uracil-DNA glycosylase family 4